MKLRVSLSILGKIIIITVFSVQTLGYSVQKATPDFDAIFDYTTIKNSARDLATETESSVLADVTEIEEIELNDQGAVYATTELFNEADNEIERVERDVSGVEKLVENESVTEITSAFRAESFTEQMIETTPSAFSSDVDDGQLPIFTRPITPDPNANPADFVTVNPLPDDYNRDELDLNITEDAVFGRAACQCGKAVSRIVGGEPARISHLPWTAALLRGSGGRPYCGGTLINSLYVVTASHCVDGMSAGGISVLLNEQDFNSQSESRPQKFAVSQITMHPNYNRKTIDNDIALLRLSRSVSLSNSGPIVPVCLPASNTNHFAREQATVAGWGTTSSGGGVSSHLRKVTVPVLSNNDCNTKTKYTNKITENMLCAGLLETGGKDSCQGDSGGPLIIDNGGRKTLIGVVSWGYGCAAAYSPGVYTRVGRFPDWILSNTRGADWCEG